MNRKETTEFLGQLLISTRFGGAGKHWASEVSIDPWGREAKRVDYMQFSPADQRSTSGIEKGIFTCYEVKSCKEDVYSGNGLGVPTQEFKTCFICGRHLAMNRIPIVISISGKGNRFACDKCYEKSQREKEHEKTEL